MPRDVMHGRAAYEFDEVFAVLELDADDRDEDGEVDEHGRPVGPPPDAPKGIEGLNA